MVEAIQAKKYFQPPEGYFWRWAENGEVVEWSSGRTICYRDDLIEILKELAAVGFPRVSPLLLVLFACKEKITLQEKFFLLRCADGSSGQHLTDLIDKALELLKLIDALPDSLKKGKQRIHLIYELFQESGLVFKTDDLRDAVDELNSGRIDSSIVRPAEPFTKEQFAEDLQCLANALSVFPNLQSLEAKLKTGIQEIPSETVLILPETPPADLINQLAEDPKTLGMARLVRRLLAALNIPLHSQGSGDQPIGGISDITNRGNFDKLLLSELAYDDELLMARLVNNEALYFRREAPPDHPKQQRVVLVDSTIKMWGIPRIFALSASIACVRNLRKGTFSSAFSLGGASYKEINFDSREAVLQSMESMDHSLHCGPALVKSMKDINATVKDEFIFITEASLLNSPSFQGYYAEVKHLLSFVITVSRDGDLQLYQCVNGNTKLLSSAKLDLESLLFAPPEKHRAITDIELADIVPPAFLAKMPAPLLYPEVRIKRDGFRMYVSDQTGVFVVNETQRLLYIASSNCGARELLNYVDKGDYYFGMNGPGCLYLLVNNNQRKLVKFYSIDLHTNAVELTNLSEEIFEIKMVRFDNNKFYIRDNYNTYLFDCRLNRVIEKKVYGGFPEHFTYRETVDNGRVFDKYVDAGSSVLIHIKELYINDSNKLVLGKQYLSVPSKRHIKIADIAKKQTRVKESHELPDVYKPLLNKHVKFSVRRWPDGTEAMIDSRGLLHLKSTDTSIPEITIILVLGRTTACWAADGVASGNSYYIDDKASTIIPALDFYENYIQRFIDSIS